MYVVKKLQSCRKCCSSAPNFTFCKYYHITPILIELHWLPISECMLNSFKAPHQLSPTYIKDWLHAKYWRHPEHSSHLLNYFLICVDFNLKSYGSQAFAFSILELWNSLPNGIPWSACLNPNIIFHLWKFYITVLALCLNNDYGLFSILWSTQSRSW